MDLDYSKEPHGVFMVVDNKSFYASVESVKLGLNPMKSILVVLSENDNTNGGLILATSPMAKKRYHLKNVDRKRDLPHDDQMIIVPPRMNLYIEKNIAVNNIFKQFAAEADVYPYSIDESIIDMSKSWKLFGKTHQEVARNIQLAVKRELGLYTTVGIGENPLQAKLALDILAKHDHDMIGELTYESFGQHIWPIRDLSSIWSIGNRTAKHLNELGIDSIGDLAHTDPYYLQQEFGIIGGQLFALANGIDRAQLDQPVKAKSKSVGNSQVLAHDYHHSDEIKVLIREIGEQVAARLRHQHKQATIVSLHVGFSFAAQADGLGDGFAHSKRIDRSDNSTELIQYLIAMFDKYWHGESVRNVAVSYGGLIDGQGEQIDLFKPVDTQLKHQKLDRLVDEIRDKFGVNAIMHPYNLKAGATRQKRSKLVGGHNGGNSFK
ncbi:Y-family DNA polymerase (plasmid) [Nicoliella spurrieriana]|uniref:Y-family DNA polymerase n=1 Tax=Nicoliella spurrieriana TaxID=2925830 RepID=A0A976RR54_9LACO|nr:Y-family DNA polymerase [Nicoliella spurrieriana]UQS86106.1 Y-family DNA polymerase [Nicoliella spurrieriana]